MTQIKPLEAPEESTADSAHSLAETGLSFIPVVGEGISKLFSAIIIAPVEKRKSQWMVDVTERINELGKAGKINIEELQNNNAFIDTLMHASQIAIRNSQEEKIQSLLNATLNTAISPDIDETYRSIFLNFVDTLTTLHIKFLKEFTTEHISTTTRPNGFVDFPEELFDGDIILYKQIWKDLADNSLIDADQPFPTKEKTTITIKISELGGKFIDFISTPAT